MNPRHGNKGQELRDFTMRNSTNSSIQRLDFSDTILAYLGFFRSNFPVASSKFLWKCFSELDNEFAMPLFYDQIRQDLPTDIEKSVTCNGPFINISFKQMVSSFFKGCTTCTLKSFLKPMKEFDVSIGDLKNSSIMSVLIAISGFVFKFTSMKTALTINNPGEISQMNGLMFFWFVFNPMFMIYVVELHNTPYGYKFTNQYTHGIV